MFKMKTNQKAKKMILMVLTLLTVLMVSPVFGVKLSVLPDLNRPIYIDIRENEVYVLDEPVVNVYALEDCPFREAAVYL